MSQSCKHKKTIKLRGGSKGLKKVCYDCGEVIKEGDHGRKRNGVQERASEQAREDSEIAGEAG